MVNTRIACRWSTQVTYVDGQHTSQVHCQQPTPHKRFDLYSTHLENEASYHASLGKMRILLIQSKITWNPV